MTACEMCGDNCRKHLPKLDDWVDGKPDAWDYDTVLAENSVIVEWHDTVIDGEGTKHPAGEFAGWNFVWTHGCIHIGPTTETIAQKGAALFVSLWLRGVSASFCAKLMDGYIVFLERQENTSLTFLAEIKRDYWRDYWSDPYFQLTREGFCTQESFDCATEKIIEALDIQPDEEIIVTFAKRKK